MRQLLVLDLVTDLSIGLACAAIAFALIHFARRPTGLPYARVFVAFAVFIIADGATHLAAVWSVWQPSAWLATLLKVATALASVAAALVLPPLVPKALGLGAASAMLDGAPDAILLVDGTGVIRLVNERAERLFGYSRSELLGRPSTLVLPDDVRAARDVQRDVYGLRRDVRFLVPVTVTVLSERRRRAPWGLAGGQPGAPGRNLLIRGGVEQELPGKFTLDLAPGDVLSIQTPGGGGWGDYL